LSNYRELIADILEKEGGIKGFYKGISLNMVKAPLSIATVWTVKNHLNRILDKGYDL
jgi:solute carrier family 25 protein 42